MHRFALCLGLAALTIHCGGQPSPPPESASPSITHGPMLGRLGESEIGVWARTATPGEFRVRYGTSRDALDQASEPVQTALESDNTAWAHLTGLRSNTKYYYDIVDGGGRTAPGLGGDFHTLPSAEDYRNAEHNREGLFNLRFEFACGNNQGANGSVIGPELTTYQTMYRELHRDAERSRVDFAVLNGDWLYEEMRDFTADQWAEQVQLGAATRPPVVEVMPTIAGVWENYKLYLSRGKPLAEWHKAIPSFFTFDDHEIVNDVYGSGEVGRYDRRAVFRDIGVKAWYDYLGWSNPVEHTQPMFFGKAGFQAGSDILTDAAADFSSLDLNQAATLHVHWGTPDAGAMLGAPDSEGGDPNAGVYEIIEILDNNRLRIRPAAKQDGQQSYSIGRLSYFKKTVGNSDIIFLDTRTHREMHDVNDRAERGRTMLGQRQKAWLKDQMTASEANFFFVFSSVNFMIPHIGGTGTANIPTANKDDAWTVFLDEREELIRFWDGLGKPVFVLTGDLHNSFAIKITDRVWEFASGPHNSVNHPVTSEGNRPVNGEYDSFGRKGEIRWSTYLLGDTPNQLRVKPIYTVIQVNNVFNNPNEPGKDRWIAFPRPQMVLQYYDGLSGELLYSESVLASN